MSVIPSSGSSITLSSAPPMQTEGGLSVSTLADSNGAQYVRINDPKSAYGAVSVSNDSPVWNIDCTYGPPSGVYMEYTTGSTGSTGGEDGSMYLSTGTGAGGFVAARGQIVFRPQAGRGVSCEVVAKMSSPALNSYQLVGPLTAEDGCAVGFDNTGTIKHYQKTGGVREVQTLTITTGAGGAETATITLNGTGTDVVLASGTPTQNARTISRASFSGWTAYAIGDTVVFLSNSSGALSGSFSLSSTGSCAGTFAETVPGEAGTESFVAQADWNIDPMDGTGASGYTLDLTKVFAARWILTEFSAEFQVRTDTGFHAAHRVTTLGTTNGKLFQNQTLKMQFVAYNAGNTTDIRTYIFTSGASLDGEEFIFGARRGLSQSKAGIGSGAEVPVISLRNSPTFGNPARVFTSSSIITDFSIANRGSKGCTVSLVRAGTLTGDVWSNVSALGVLQTDTSSTARAGGIVLFSRTVAGGDTRDYDLRPLRLFVEEADQISIVAIGTASATTDITVDIGVIENR